MSTQVRDMSVVQRYSNVESTHITFVSIFVLADLNRYVCAKIDCST